MPFTYEVELFKEKGFRRVKCQSCGRFFWTFGEQEICGDPPCEEYSFIGNSPTKKKFNLHEMREAFLSFFEKRKHPRIARYPVVSRWRDDTFFTIASISCYQPWVLNRTIEPPANPLVMSQTCLRFNDIDNVGKSGRHLTLFEMMAHHAFNTKENFVYFNDKTVELCHEFLISLGVPEKEVAYVEEQWAGGGNSGPCFEVVVRGNEVATLVFMMYDDLPNGKKKEMEMQVVDTGYGLERFAWLSLGTPNVYEAIFPSVLEKLKREAKVESDKKILGEYAKLAGMVNVESNLDVKELREKVAKRIGMGKGELEGYVLPLEHLYTICDHTKALMFILNDGMVPSNVKGGYFARLLARRTLRSLKFLKLEISLREIVDWQIDDLKKSFPELGKNKEDILKITDVEEEKYGKTVKKGRVMVVELEGKKKKELTTNDLITLYDTHGLTPELVKEFSKLKVEIPDDFYIKVAKRHEKPLPEEEKKEKIKIPKGIPDTKLGFYEDANVKKFKAKVLAVFDSGVVLDRTYFYAEAGGQEGDIGKIANLEVIDTQKEGGVILHKVKAEGKVKVGELVECKVNWKRRFQLMQHHTSAHIINGAARKVLGNHVFQAGAHKSEKLGRLDITHYASLTKEEVGEIEKVANEVVKENRGIEIKFMSRDKAEEKFGFGIYQGGAVPGKKIRIVNIKGWDVEACGGTHFSSTGEVGKIKLVRVKRIQDGVIRLEFKAGQAFEDYGKELETLSSEACLEISSEEELTEIASLLSIPVAKVPETLERFKEEWEEQRKEIKKLEEKIKGLGGEKLSFSKKYKKMPAGTPCDIVKKLFQEWKAQRKDLEILRKELSRLLEKKLEEKFEEKKGVKVVKEIFPDLEVKNLLEIAKEVIEDKKNALIILVGTRGKKASLVVKSTSKINAVEIAKKISQQIGGGAQGDEKLAIGGGSSKDIEKILNKIEI